MDAWSPERREAIRVALFGRGRGVAGEGERETRLFEEGQGGRRRDPRVVVQWVSVEVNVIIII